MGEGDFKLVHDVELIGWDYDKRNLTAESIEKLELIRSEIKQGKYVLATEKKSVREEGIFNPRKRKKSILNQDSNARDEMKRFGSGVLTNQ